MRILCADDEPAIRDVLRALLRREGFEVQTAANGHEAWRTLSSARGAFTLLITDNEMPVVTGAQLVQRLREAGDEIKIIVFSASLSSEDEEAFHAWQADAVLAKGAPIDELLGEIRRLVQPTPVDAPERRP